MKEKIKLKKCSKILLLSSSILIIILLMFSLVLQLLAGRNFDYYLLNEMSISLIKTSRQIAGVAVFGIIMFEIVLK